MKEVQNEVKNTDKYHDRLQNLIDSYAHLVYKVTKSFPKEEIYGSTSQIRRASLSVALNYVEGYARGTEKSYVSFLTIAYASLKESLYLVIFTCNEGYMSKEQSDELLKQGNEIGRMIWGILRNKKI